MHKRSIYVSACRSECIFTCTWFGLISLFNVIRDTMLVLWDRCMYVHIAEKENNADIQKYNLLLFFSFHFMTKSLRMVG